MRGLARRLASVLCALLLGCPAGMAADDDWTVLTMAQDGSWGVACDGAQWRAMAEAMRFCRSMAGATGASDCGANFAATKGGWIVANLCGDYKVLATGATLGDAETEVLNREISLQLQFVPDLPPCRRVVTVDAGRSTIVSSLRIPPARTNFSIATPGGR
ncbi:MAG: hypothetical protein ABWY63_00060 [Hyphomicrobiaceae bacterium]